MGTWRLRFWPQGPRPGAQRTPAWALPSEAALSTARQAERPHEPGRNRPREHGGARRVPLPETLASPPSLLGGRACRHGCELGLGAEGPRASGEKRAWGATLGTPVLVALPAADAVEAERTAQAIRGAQQHHAGPEGGQPQVSGLGPHRPPTHRECKAPHVPVGPREKGDALDALGRVRETPKINGTCSYSDAAARKFLITSVAHTCGPRGMSSSQLVDPDAGAQGRTAATPVPVQRTPHP